MNINSSQYAKKNSAQFGLYNKLAAHGPANQKAPPGSLQPATAKPARSMLRSADDQVSADPKASKLCSFSGFNRPNHLYFLVLIAQIGFIFVF
jgi:hypothetical protein